MATSPFFKESLGFAEGEDVDAYMVDRVSGIAEHLGPLRMEYVDGDTRLFERWDLQLDSADTQNIYFGQKNHEPFIIELKADPGAPEYEPAFSGRLKTNRFTADARLVVYSSYTRERWILTLSISRSENRRGPAEDILPKGWSSTQS